MILTSTTERTSPAGRLARGGIRRRRGLRRQLGVTWLLLKRKARRTRRPPESEYLRRDLALLPLERPWGPWDYL